MPTAVASVQRGRWRGSAILNQGSNGCAVRKRSAIGRCPAHGRRNSQVRISGQWTTPNWEAKGGDAETVHCSPVLKITQRVLIRLENFLFYLILQGLSKFAF